MPMTSTDFSKGLIYKLCSNDTDIKDIYVGSTTSFKHRKYNHKSICYNEKNKNYNSYVYKFIRENGGWEAWNMILVESYPCKTRLELEKREREIIEQLKSTLNKNIPTRTKKEYCYDNKEHRKEYNEKNKEKLKEQRKEYLIKNKEKIAEYNKQTITCECGAITRKSHLERHKKSKKHQNNINALHSHHT